MKRVASRDNPEYRELAALAKSAGARRERGLALLEGVHLCREFRQCGGTPRAAWVAAGAEAADEIAALVAGVATVRVAEPRLLAAVGSLESPAPLLYVVETPRAPVPDRLRGDAAWLDRVQDPGNVGSILRSCAAAGVRTVLLGPGCAGAWSPKALRAGQGAHFHLHLHEEASPGAWLPRLVSRLVVTDAGADTSLYDADLAPATVWAFGHEGSGVCEALSAAAALRVRIPQRGSIESINVAAAAAVCLFEQLRQRRTAR